MKNGMSFLFCPKFWVDYFLCKIQKKSTMDCTMSSFQEYKSWSWKKVPKKKINVVNVTCVSITDILGYPSFTNERR